MNYDDFNTFLASIRSDKDLLEEVQFRTEQAMRTSATAQEYYQLQRERAEQIRQYEEREKIEYIIQNYFYGLPVEEIQDLIKTHRPEVTL